MYDSGDNARKRALRLATFSTTAPPTTGAVSPVRTSRPAPAVMGPRRRRERPEQAEPVVRARHRVHISRVHDGARWPHASDAADSKSGAKELDRLELYVARNVGERETGADTGTVCRVLWVGDDVPAREATRATGEDDDRGGSSSSESWGSDAEAEDEDARVELGDAAAKAKASSHVSHGDTERDALARVAAARAGAAMARTACCI